MKILRLSIPYPPSVNRTYYNRTHLGDNLRGRGLTKEASVYKNTVADLIHYSFPFVNFGKQEIKVTILDYPPNRRGDNHNCIKIVFDAIERSGLIDNDKQIVSHEIIPAEIKNPAEWILKIEPYYGVHKILDKIRFYSEQKQEEQEKRRPHD